MIFFIFFSSLVHLYSWKSTSFRIFVLKSISRLPRTSQFLFLKRKGGNIFLNNRQLAVALKDAKRFLLGFSRRRGSTDLCARPRDDRSYPFLSCPGGTRTRIDVAQRPDTFRSVAPVGIGINGRRMGNGWRCAVATNSQILAENIQHVRRRGDSGLLLGGLFGSDKRRIVDESIRVAIPDKRPFQ